MIVSLVLALIEARNDWPRLASHYAGMAISADRMVALVLLVTLALVLLLTLLASRRRNAAALVLLALLFLAGLPQIVHQLRVSGIGGAPPLAILGLVAQLLAFACAATAPARRWFRARDVGQSERPPTASDGFPT